MKIDIAGKMKSWIEHDDLTHIIDITCPTCQPHPSLDLLRLDNDYRPFIVVNTYTNRTAKRPKRHINCSAGVTSCCRDRLYISFAEIGWNDWILHPPGYDAYFCRGSCASAATITLSGSYYNSVLRVGLVVVLNKQQNEKLTVPPLPFRQIESDVLAQQQGQQLGVGAVLFAHHILVAAAVLHGQQQYGHAENAAQHGGGGVRLHVRLYVFELLDRTYFNAFKLYRAHKHTRTRAYNNAQTILMVNGKSVCVCVLYIYI